MRLFSKMYRPNDDIQNQSSNVIYTNANVWPEWVAIDWLLVIMHFQSFELLWLLSKYG